MNKINCEKCEHDKVCRFKMKLRDVSRKYENFIADKVSYPFVTSLICEEFKEVESMPRGAFTTNNTKEGANG